MPSRDLLVELVDRWADAHEQGDELKPEELCHDCPELLPQLEQQIAMLRAMDARLAGQTTNRSSDAPYDSLAAQTELDELTLLAKGGLGIVYSAEDQRLGRRVAVKFLQQEHFHDELSRRQFLLEAEVTSRLEHPGVAPVYCVGEVDEGRPFYAMRLIDGQTLDQAIDDFHSAHPSGVYDEQGSELRTLLQRFITVCRTIAYAHNRGILHRDIKPSNVMLGRYGETLVVDWGLAMAVGREDEFKLADERTLMPQVTSDSSSSDSMAGTPAYMSPEQISGAAELQPASDIYSLGATLYRLLTDHSPIETADISELRQRAIRGEFPRPRVHAPALSKPLEAICLKALATDPGDRYRTALRLAEDLEHHLADEPVSAYQESFSYVAARWVKRHLRVVQTAAAALLSLLLLTTVFSAWQSSTAQRANAARREGLVSRATLAAGGLASELDRRLLVLEGAARDQRLIDAVRAAYDAPDDQAAWEAVNQWLTNQRDYWAGQRRLKSYCWIVNLNDGRGTQIARAPKLDEATGEPAKSLGRSLARREYFHGQGPIYQADETSEITPTANPIICTPFQGTNNEPVLAFSVPIRDTLTPNSDPVVIGVLGMAVEVFDITNLDAQLGEGQALTIVHRRLDLFDKQQTRRGLVMQHDLFHKQGGDGAPHWAPYWLTEATLDRIEAADCEPMLMTDYQDRLAEVSPALGGAWLAAVAPVLLPSRDDETQDSGWCVIVQERL
ncbi:Serine/threonine-protein kinase PknD [Posidoniimonas polymericola]|uniref:Serine/threonine-protein kinase PknD n=1 Tax=Posidoniimonas polymericola TaxID=2528002 RepID=A0A5C5YMP3_9BACT|nr:serine/threonine-protein kinase [Posidoniimonas polymericola]TWT76153.1 Serine/threonine-protein kinase PknD [Posidoniimonas polymericola]